jgi:hypothetical protein
VCLSDSWHPYTLCSSFKGQTPREKAWTVATRLAPCLTWLSKYEPRKQLAPDVLAGIAVAFLIIPQGLSYAGIAGLPAIYGLCACALRTTCKPLHACRCPHASAL